MKTLVVFYSMYGHVYQMAEEIAKGVREVKGAEAELRRVPETIPDAVLKQYGALEAQKAFAHVPFASVDELASSDAIIFGTPTRFGNMAGQMRQFLDTTGQVWAKGGLVGKVASVFTSTSTQHGGQESTILSFHTTMLHHGMVIVGLPFSFAGISRIDEMSGGSPYGASTITGGDGSRLPSDNERAGARYQGKYVATVASQLGKVDVSKL